MAPSWLSLHSCQLVTVGILWELCRACRAVGALSLAQAWRGTPGIPREPPRVVLLSVLSPRARLAQSLRGDRVSTQELCISGSWRGKEEQGRNAERTAFLLGKGILQAKKKLWQSPEALDLDFLEEFWLRGVSAVTCRVEKVSCMEMCRRHPAPVWVCSLKKGCGDSQVWVYPGAGQQEGQHVPHPLLMHKRPGACKCPSLPATILVTWP